MASQLSTCKNRPGFTAQAGFTLVELVVVLLLIGVLASIGASRFSSTDAFAARNLADQMASALRSTQATAIAQRRTVYLSITAAPPSMSACFDPGCTLPLAAPSTDGNWLPSASGLNLDTGLSFQWQPDGSTNLGNAQAV
jgi:MSHA pilin protein MshC